MTVTESAVPTANNRKVSTLARYHARWGWIFISPWIIGFLAFILLPIVFTLVMSFTDYNAVVPDEVNFIGLQNYKNMAKDALVSTSLLVTVRYGLLAIPIGLSFALLLATIANSKHLIGTSIFRTLAYMPNLIPVVAGTIIWGGVMNTQTGWINLALEAVGIPGPDWLNSTSWIYPALVLIGLWGLGSVFLTLLAGMQGVPSELYDAARVDGANDIQSFFNITVPMITPVIMYNLTLMLIGAFKYFDVAYVLKNGTGDPGNSTLFYNLYLYKNAFVFNLMGYASAQAWFLFIIVLILTIILFLTSKYWVYYASEG